MKMKPIKFRTNIPDGYFEKKKLSLLECSEKAENLKLKDMDNWLDEQLAKINSGTKEHELVFKHYNNINNIRTFYAQKLFDKQNT
jgi:sulfur relay (sulfurtransferase) DsrC/TusE family protein